MIPYELNERINAEVEKLMSNIDTTEKLTGAYLGMDFILACYKIRYEFEGDKNRLEKLHETMSKLEIGYKEALEELGKEDGRNDDGRVEE